MRKTRCATSIAHASIVWKPDSASIVVYTSWSLSSHPLSGFTPVDLLQNVVVVVPACAATEQHNHAKDVDWKKVEMLSQIWCGAHQQNESVQQAPLKQQSLRSAQSVVV